MKIEITRILEFDAAHRVMGHESKCATMHGHRYKVEITAKAERLDSLGRVIDFSVIKSKIGTWIDENWDHTTIVFKKDEKLVDLLFSIDRIKNPFVAGWNPTAENMAEYLLHIVCARELENSGVMVTKVRVYETPNCWAEAFL